MVVIKKEIQDIYMYYFNFNKRLTLLPYGKVWCKGYILELENMSNFMKDYYYGRKN